MICSVCKKDAKKGVFKEDKIYCSYECIMKMVSDDINKHSLHSEYPFIPDYILDGIIDEGDEEKLKHGDYVVIYSTDANEIGVHPFASLDGVKAEIINHYTHHDGSSWSINSVYDMVNKKKLTYDVKVVVTIEGE